MARPRRGGADRRGGGAAEAGQRGDRAVRGARPRRGTLERGDQRAQPRGPDPRDLRERQVRGYLVATPARSACHSVSSSSGTPAPVTAEIATTGAPPCVQIVGRGDAGAERSTLVSTTMWGFAASSGEYDAASRSRRSYVACGSGLSTGTSTATSRVRSTCCRNLRPNPFPRWAPSMIPGISAATNVRWSDNATTPRCGSSVVNG